MSGSRWLAPIIWVAVIELLTSWPSLPEVPAPEGTDKLVHFVLYGVLSFLVLRAVQGTRPTAARVGAVLLVVAAWGALDEWHQRFIPTRDADVKDWAADAVGAAGGLLARLFVSRRVASGERRS